VKIWRSRKSEVIWDEEDWFVVDQFVESVVQTFKNQKQLNTEELKQLLRMECCESPEDIMAIPEESFRAAKIPAAFQRRLQSPKERVLYKIDDNVKFIARLKEYLPANHLPDFKIVSPEAHIYPTISDSISDGNDIWRRIINILTTVCAYIIMAFLFLEYLGVSLDKQQEFGYFVSGTIALATLVFVPLFPNNAIRQQKFIWATHQSEMEEEKGYGYWVRFSNTLHLFGISLTVIIFAISVGLYVHDIYDNGREINLIGANLVITLYVTFMISFVIFLICDQSKKYVKSQNTLCFLHCMTYIFETLLLLSMVFSFLLSCWFRTPTLLCFPGP